MAGYRKLIDSLYKRVAQIETLYRFSQFGEKWDDTVKMPVMLKNKRTARARIDEVKV